MTDCSALPQVQGFAPYACGDGWALYCADMLDLIPALEDACIDVVLTDPPYSSGGLYRGDRTKSTAEKYVWQKGLAAAHNAHSFQGDSRDQRSYMVWCGEWMRHSSRVLRPAGYLASFIDWRQLPTMSDAFQYGGLTWRGVACWDKTRGIRPQPGHFRAQCEFLIWGTRGPLPMVQARTRPVLPGCFTVAPLKGPKFHQAGKPESLMQQLIEIALPGEIVADWFAGSGTTGVAAIRSGRRFIGVELDPVFCEIAAERLRAAEREKAQAA